MSMDINARHSVQLTFYMINKVTIANSSLLLVELMMFFYDSSWIVSRDSFPRKNVTELTNDRTLISFMLNSV